MKRLLSMALISVLVAGGPVYAHSDDYLDTLKAPHNGQLRMAGQFHIELVAKGDALILYVTDHAFTPQESEGATGTAVVITDKNETTVKLEPAGENMLKGTGTFRLTPTSTIKVTVVFPDDQPQTAQFTPLKKHAAVKKMTPAPTSGVHHDE